MSDLAKIELHLHLEGAAPPALIRSLAAEQHVDLSGLFAADGSYAWRGFDGFLRSYEAACTVLRSPAAYARLAREVQENLAREGVIYAELFVCPDLCGGGDPGAWAEHVAAMGEALAQGTAQGGPEIRLIATLIRHFGPERGRRAAVCAAETAGGLVTGLGLAGDETCGHPRDHAWAYDCAREAGLGLTAHAGEWQGPEGIRDTLRALRVTRLGHGVRAIEDPALVDHLAETGVVLETCPGSNLALGLYPGWRAHPVDRLRRAGVRVTLSTDDPTWFQTTLGQEYDRLARAFDWDSGDFTALNRTAAEAAFCDPETRTALLARLEEPR